MKRTGLWLLPALAVLGACSSQGDDETPAAQRTLHEVMTEEIDIRADEVWAIGNAAMDDVGGLDPLKLIDDDWASLALHAEFLQDAARHLASLDPIVVVRPGVKIADEDVPYGDSAASVQANIDEDPQGLRDMANTLAIHMGELAAAAEAQDADRAGQLLNGIDGICEDCHLKYWYPSQPEIIEQLRRQNQG